MDRAPPPPPSQRPLVIGSPASFHHATRAPLPSPSPGAAVMVPSSSGGSSATTPAATTLNTGTGTGGGPRYFFAEEPKPEVGIGVNVGAQAARSEAQVGGTAREAGCGYALVMRQNPEKARICSFKDKIDRRPVDPPPIVQVTATPPPSPPSNPTPGPSDVVSRQLRQANNELLTNGNLFLIAKLVEAETGEEVRTESGQKCTAGTTIQSPHRLRDLDGTMVVFFAFPDLSIRVEGSHKLMFCLYGIDPATGLTRQLTTVLSDTFIVLPPKHFPGMSPSTLLTRHIADQGFKLRVRKKNRAVITHVKRTISDNSVSGSGSGGSGGSDRGAGTAGRTKKGGKRAAKSRREKSPEDPDPALLGIGVPGPSGEGSRSGTSAGVAGGMVADDERDSDAHSIGIGPSGTPTRTRRGTRGSRGRGRRGSAARRGAPSITPAAGSSPTIPEDTLPPAPYASWAGPGGPFPGVSPYRAPSTSAVLPPQQVPGSQAASAAVAASFALPQPNRPRHSSLPVPRHAADMPPPLHPASAAIQPPAMPSAATSPGGGFTLPPMTGTPPLVLARTHSSSSSASYAPVPHDAPRTLPHASEGLSSLMSNPQPRPYEQVLPSQRLPVGLASTMGATASTGSERRIAAPAIASAELSATTSEYSNAPSSAPLSTEPSTAASEPPSSADPSAGYNTFAQHGAGQTNPPAAVTDRFTDYFDDRLHHPSNPGRRRGSVQAGSVGGQPSGAPRMVRRSSQPAECPIMPQAPEGYGGSQRGGPSFGRPATPGEQRVQLPPLLQVFPDDPYFRNRPNRDSGNVPDVWNRRAP